MTCLTLARRLPRVGGATNEREVSFRSANELREVLERLLAAADDDDRAGPLLRAARIRTRFVFADAGLHLNLASSESDDRYLEWSFAPRPPWEPKVTLRMDSRAANRWLQGRESLAIAIARGQVRCRGDARAVLFFIPVASLLTDSYRRLIDSEYDHLRVA